MVIWIWNTIWSIQTLNKLFSLCFKRFKWHNIFNYTISLKLCLIFLILSIKWCQHRASRKVWYMWRNYFLSRTPFTLSYSVAIRSYRVCTCILYSPALILSYRAWILSYHFVVFFNKITLRVLYMFIWLCMFAFAS